MAAASLLLALALSADHAFYRSSLRAELGLSTPQPGALAAPQLSLRPSLEAGLVSGAFRAQLGYRPQLTFTGLKPALLHQVAVGGEWRLSPSRRARVDQQLSFGQYDTSLGNLGGPGAIPLPDSILPLATVDYLSSDTAAGLEGALSPRLRLRGSIGYRATGGLTAATRSTLPLQHGPHLGLELQHDPTRRDAVSGQLRLSGNRSSNGRTSAIAEGSAGWRTRLTRDAVLQLGAGVAAVAASEAGGAPGASAVPVASFGMTWELPRLRLAADGRLSPQPDALTGSIYQRAGAGVSGEYRPRSDVTVRTSGGASWSVAGENAGDRTVQGEAQVSYREDLLEVSAGVRVAEVALSRSATPHAVEVRGFVGLSLKGPEAR